MTSIDVDKPAAAAFMQGLRHDHAGMSRMLRAIDGALDRLATEPEAVQPFLVEAFGYLLGYQHGYHHPREDRLFEKIRRRRPELSSTLARLAEEHATGEAETAALAEQLAASTPGRLRAKKGERLAGRIQDYIRHARLHMRDEEAVFYARAEQVLSTSDWAAIIHDGVDNNGRQDPLADMNALAGEYPALAAHFDLPIRHLGSGEATDRGAGALHQHLLGLTDLYGGLMHEGFELTRRNTRRLLSVRGPLGLMRAVTAVTSDNLRFAGQCVTRPSRWAIETGTELVGVRTRPDRQQG